MSVFGPIRFIDIHVFSGVRSHDLVARFMRNYHSSLLPKEELGIPVSVYPSVKRDRDDQRDIHFVRVGAPTGVDTDGLMKAAALLGKEFGDVPVFLKAAEGPDIQLFAPRPESKTVQISAQPAGPR